jgi:NAD(P)H dehydrogenase (quinone)
MKIAVTAASGRLGQAILKVLSEQLGPEHVVGIARSPEKIDVPDIEKRQGDYHSVEDFVAAFDGIDTAIMISAPVTTGTDRVAMHRNVVEGAKRAGVRKLLYTSLIGNGKEEGTQFFATQQVNRQAEQDLEASGLEWVIARNGLYLELDTKHIIRADETGVYHNNGGDGRCGYLTIDELAFGTAKLAIDDRHNGRIYNLIGEPVTQAELVATASQVFGLNIEYQVISSEDNVERFMQDETIAARGIEVARMLTGCFECIAAGAFDVESDFEAATGRPAKTIREQMEEIRQGSNRD